MNNYFAAHFAAAQRFRCAAAIRFLPAALIWPRIVLEGCSALLVPARIERTC